MNHLHIPQIRRRIDPVRPTGLRGMWISIWAVILISLTLTSLNSLVAAQPDHGMPSQELSTTHSEDPIRGARDLLGYSSRRRSRRTSFSAATEAR